MKYFVSKIFVCETWRWYFILTKQAFARGKKCFYLESESFSFFICRNLGCCFVGFFLGKISYTSSRALCSNSKMCCHINYFIQQSLHSFSLPTGFFYTSYWCIVAIIQKRHILSFLNMSVYQNIVWCKIDTYIHTYISTSIGVVLVCLFFSPWFGSDSLISFVCKIYILQFVLCLFATNCCYLLKILNFSSSCQS